VILDDYQQVALGYADWSRLAAVGTTTVDRHLADEATLVAALIDAEIVVVMRERTPLTAPLLDRLPRLRLVVASGMRNASIDLAACAERGVTVCGTASSSTPPAELTWALVLALARQVVPEALALRAGGVADDDRHRPCRGDAGPGRPRQDRRPGRRSGPRIRYGGGRLEPTPHR